MEGTITLKQAWESWRMIPDNMTLAINSRAAFNDILLNMHGNMPLTDFESEVFTRDIFKDVEDKDAKIKAASILVYLMEYGASKGYCKMPSYDETIAIKVESTTLPEKPKRGRKPKAEINSDSKPLRDLQTLNIKEATDQQLYNELLRRGWQGELTRLEVLKPQK